MFSPDVPLLPGTLCKGLVMNEVSNHPQVHIHTTQIYLLALVTQYPTTYLPI